MTNSIVANSVLGLGGTSLECYDLSSNSSIAIDGATIIEDGTCGALRAVDPRLLPLADNDGPTQTHAISLSSIARNSAPAVSCTMEDQRQIVRNVNDAFCDVGAYEFVDESSFFIIPLSGGRAVVLPL